MLTNTLWETIKNENKKSVISFFCSQPCCGGFHSFSLTFRPGRTFLCSKSSHEDYTPVDSFKEQEETEMCKVVVGVCRCKGADTSTTNLQKSHVQMGSDACCRVKGFQGVRARVYH